MSGIPSLVPFGVALSRGVSDTADAFLAEGRREDDPVHRYGSFGGKIL